MHASVPTNAIGLPLDANDPASATLRSDATGVEGRRRHGRHHAADRSGIAALVGGGERWLDGERAGGRPRCRRDAFGWTNAFALDAKAPVHVHYDGGFAATAACACCRSRRGSQSRVLWFVTRRRRGQRRDVAGGRHDLAAMAVGHRARRLAGRRESSPGTRPRVASRRSRRRLTSRPSTRTRALGVVLSGPADRKRCSAAIASRWPTSVHAAAAVVVTARARPGQAIANAVHGSRELRDHEGARPSSVRSARSPSNRSAAPIEVEENLEGSAAVSQAVRARPTRRRVGTSRRGRPRAVPSNGSCSTTRTRPTPRSTSRCARATASGAPTSCKVSTSRAGLAWSCRSTSTRCAKTDVSVAVDVRIGAVVATQMLDVRRKRRGMVARLARSHRTIGSSPRATASSDATTWVAITNVANNDAQVDVHVLPGNRQVVAAAMLTVAEDDVVWVQLGGCAAGAAPTDCVAFPAGLRYSVDVRTDEGTPIVAQMFEPECVGRDGADGGSAADTISVVFPSGGVPGGQGTLSVVRRSASRAGARRRDAGARAVERSGRRRCRASSCGRAAAAPFASSAGTQPPGSDTAIIVTVERAGVRAAVDARRERRRDRQGASPSVDAGSWSICLRASSACIARIDRFEDLRSRRRRGGRGRGTGSTRRCTPAARRSGTRRAGSTGRRGCRRSTAPRPRRRESTRG